jgi:DNA-binding transcriptional MerR regulator
MVQGVFYDREADVGGLTIGRLAKEAGVGAQALRFYERKGLLPKPPRSDGGYRLYPESAAGRVGFILRAQDLGFSLREVKELLELHASDRRSCREASRFAAAKIGDIDRKLVELSAIRKALGRLREACASGVASGECPILDHMAEPGGIRRSRMQRKRRSK